MWGCIAGLIMAHLVPHATYQFMPEQVASDFRVTIDERIMLALDKKRPIGQSRTSYINLLLQRAVINEPNRIVEREIING